MKSLILLVCLWGGNAWAAIPQQTFIECYRNTTGGTSLSVDDYKALSKVSKQTFCQKNNNAFAKADLIELLKNRTELAVAVGSTSWSKEDLIEMARNGSMTLIVDNNRISRENLIEIAKAGAQLAVVSSSGFSKDDLLAISREVPMLLAVNTNFIKEDLKQMVANKVQLVIYLAESAIGNYDLMDIVRVNPDLVSVKP